MLPLWCCAAQSRYAGDLGAKGAMEEGGGGGGGEWKFLSFQSLWSSFGMKEERTSSGEERTGDSKG